MLEGWDAERFTRDTSRSIHNAIRRAAKIVGKDVLDEYRDDGLEGTKRKRTSKARFKVNKNNTLVWVDSGLDARVREYGATIRAPAGKYLRIITDPQLREHERRDLAKGRTRETFVIKGDHGGLVLMARRSTEKEARPVAVLKRTVKRDALHENDRLSTISQWHLKKYERLIEEFIDD